MATKKATKKTWDLKSIYLYLVCLVTVFMIIANLIGTIDGIMDLFVPTENIYNMDTKLTRISEYNSLIEKNKLTRISFIEFSKLKDEAKLKAKEASKNNEIKRIIKNLFALLIASLFYKFHWDLIKKER